MNRTFLKWQTRIHRTVYKLTAGRVGGSMGAPVLLLTTTGRKSGKARTIPLFYVTTDSGWAVVGSNAGSENHPAWWLNLLANPTATVQIAGRVDAVTGRLATEAERAGLWPKFVALFDGYETYQAQSTRQMPVVILRRIS